jgi:hypothetical protein
LATVYLLSAAPANAPPRSFEDLERLRAFATVDRFGVHALTDDPEGADIVLFVEISTDAGHYFELVRRHPVYREFRAKSYLFSSTDTIVPFLPGVYASVERRRYRPAWTRSGHYLGVQESEERNYQPRAEPAQYLFSFVGSGSTHRVRRAVLELGHLRALIVDADGLRGDGYLERYVRSIRDSAFVLCPRGGGPATFRLFETMMLGRVPVILSDAWVPPLGPDWSSFSIRVAQRDVASVPKLLEARESEAEQMGAHARRAWLDWFSNEVSFHRVVEWCLDLQASAARRSGVRRFEPHMQMLRPYHAARLVAKRLGHGGRRQR